MSLTHADRLRQFDEADLYVVITEEFCAGRNPIEVLEAVLAAGVRLVQCREKNLSDHHYYERALAFKARTSEAGALLIVDDRVDIAIAVGADGIHLGQDDMPIAAARRIAPELILGASSHSLLEALAAQDAGASYVNIGPIFDTQTKAVSSGTVGPDLIDTIRPQLHIPFTTMGGIKPHNIGQVLSRGARHVAVVTAVTAAPDVKEAAQTLRNAILAQRRS
jgi:thiamine-phosphate pyrophosphorylase